MRHLTIGAALLAGALLLAGCGQTTGEPVLVSDHDGCKVYRVNPGFFEHYVYYTVCSSSERVRTSYTVSEGKGSSRNVEVDTFSDRKSVIVP